VEKYCTARQTTSENIIQRMRIAYRVPKPTQAKPEYVIRTAVALQQWLYESVSLLRYTYIAGLAITEKECVYCAVRTRHKS
jgi:hypothetical protein